jgi:hypothetical protein
MNSANESICLLADNVRNEVVTILKSQVVLKMMSLYIQIFLTLAEEVLLYPLKLFCTNIFNFPINIFFSFFSLGVPVVSFVLHRSTDEKITRIKIG